MIKYGRGVAGADRIDLSVVFCRSRYIILKDSRRHAKRRIYVVIGKKGIIRKIIRLSGETTPGHINYRA